MVKKDTRSFDARALEVAQGVNNAMLSKRGHLERERDARLLKVATALLEFKSLKMSERWLLKKNRKCGNLPPIDLVNSEFGTRHLFKIIGFIKRNNEQRC